jgi:DNA helicase-2/ATP-dependent DNA helicase PcrA
MATTNFRLKNFVDAVENCKRKINDKNEQNLGDVLKELMSKVGYIDYLIESKEEERIDNIHELAGYIFSLQSTNEELDLVSVIQEISLASAQDEMVDSNVITLMTVHTAKGLEYPFVFVVGLSDGVFPSSRSIMGDNGFVESKDAIEEERRLAYVAFTRAQKQLLISHNEGFSYASGGYLKASRFIHEISSCITPYYKPKPKVSIYDDPKPTFNKKVEYKAQSVLKDTNIDYRPGDLVNHSAYGSGIILSVESNSVRIAFKNPGIGQKVISKKFTGLKKV